MQMFCCFMKLWRASVMFFGSRLVVVPPRGRSNDVRSRTPGERERLRTPGEEERSRKLGEVERSRGCRELGLKAALMVAAGLDDVRRRG